MSYIPDITVGTNGVVYSFDPRTPETRITREDISHVRRCARSARFARGAEARDEYDTWRAGLRQQGRS